MRCRDLILTVALAGSVAAQDPDSGLRKRIESILSSTGEGGAAAEVDAFDRLRSIGALHAPELCAVLWGEGRSADSTSAELSPAERRVLARCLQAVDPRVLTTWLESYFDGAEPTAERRAQVLRVLDLAGGAAGVPLLFRIIDSMNPVERALTGVRSNIVRCLSAMLRREDRTADAISSALPNLPATTRRVLLRALGDARTRRSRAALIALLGNGEESDLQVLEQLVKGGRGHRPSLTLRGRLDSCLTSANVRIRSLAALAVAELHEPDLAPRLIDLLLDENALVRRNATVALQRMTGATYEEDVDAWRALLDRESTWFNESWPQIQDCLDSGDLGRTVQALREIAPHRLHRDPLCQHLGDLLPEAPPSIGLGIAATLVELGSAWAVDPLFRALETRDDPDDELRKAAHVALERLTGLSLPDDVEDCRERIGL